MEALRTFTAQRILELRKQYGWTQEELAQRSNLERKSIVRYENGQNIPGGKALIDLARVFNVSTDYLLGLSTEIRPIPANESDLTAVELEAVQALRRARNESERQRLLDALKVLVSPDAS
ncbi:MAG TPA: helix-turn-helix transcriptional regulator [Aggregatilineales bacterium]|nr:helix-turn-helix transcriptional regulator [Aggregatilineales bacterium]